MLTVTLSTLVMLALFASPALADFSLTLNDIKAGSAHPVLVLDGRGLVSTDTIALLFGANIAVENGTIRVVENDKTLVMQIDNLEATLNDAPVTLYSAPQVIDNKVMVPLASICEALGASISCNPEQQRINVVYKETRKDLSPQEVMDKYLHKYQTLNTYGFKGTQDVTMNMTAAGLPSGAPEKMIMNIDETINGSFSQNPVQAYMNINIKMDGGALASAKPVVTDQTMEMVLTEDRMYMKMPDGQWVEMDLNGLNIKDMMQNQGSLQDLQGTIAGLQKNQVIMSFDNDKNRQGENYWIIESYIDSETFSSMLKGIVGQLNGMMPATNGSDNQEFQKAMNEMMKSMKLNMKIKIWIDPDTYLARYGEGIMDVQMKMTIPAQDNGNGGTLNMSMQGTSSLEYYDYGAKVTLPDTSGAISFDKYLTIQTSQIKAN
ncbi:MAG: copper amine oxidase N-terminal domain-containing protein [Syntrophomonadaceae bacterium]